MYGPPGPYIRWKGRGYSEFPSRAGLITVTYNFHEVFYWVTSSMKCWHQ